MDYNNLVYHLICKNKTSSKDWKKFIHYIYYIQKYLVVYDKTKIVPVGIFYLFDKNLQ